MGSYSVDEEQNIKLASLEFEEYVMQWWHKIVNGLNKRPNVVSWNDLKQYIYIYIYIYMHAGRSFSL